MNTPNDNKTAYTAALARLRAIMANGNGATAIDSPAAQEAWREIERIKNLNGGMPPTDNNNKTTTD